MTALGHNIPVTINIGPLQIAERCDVAMASLTTRLNEDNNVERIAKSIGLPLPQPSRAASSEPYHSFWIAPSSWMIEAPFDTHEDIATLLKKEFGSSASITEQTDAWVRFDLSGNKLASYFERLTAFDFASAKSNSATRCAIEHVGCYLVMRDASLVSVIGPRSSAEFLLHAMETTAHSVF